MSSDPEIIETSTLMRTIDISLETDSQLRHTSRTKVYQCMIQSCGFATFDIWKFIQHPCVGDIGE